MSTTEATPDFFSEWVEVIESKYKSAVEAVKRTAKKAVRGVKGLVRKVASFTWKVTKFGAAVVVISLPVALYNLALDKAVEIATRGTTTLTAEVAATIGVLAVAGWIARKIYHRYFDQTVTDAVKKVAEERERIFTEDTSEYPDDYEVDAYQGALDFFDADGYWDDEYQVYKDTEFAHEGQVKVAPWPDEMGVVPASQPKDDDLSLLQMTFARDHARIVASDTFLNLLKKTREDEIDGEQILIESYDEYGDHASRYEFPIFESYWRARALTRRWLHEDRSWDLDAELEDMVPDYDEKAVLDGWGDEMALQEQYMAQTV